MDSVESKGEWPDAEIQCCITFALRRQNSQAVRGKFEVEHPPKSEFLLGKSENPPSWHSKMAA